MVLLRLRTHQHGLPDTGFLGHHSVPVTKTPALALPSVPALVLPRLLAAPGQNLPLWWDAGPGRASCVLHSQQAHLRNFDAAFRILWEALQ